MSDAPRLQAGPDLRESIARLLFEEHVGDCLEKDDWERRIFPDDRASAFRVADALLAPSGPLAPLLARIGELEAALAAIVKPNGFDVDPDNLGRARSVLDQETRHAG
jgi:hypothetical protein